MASIPATSYCPATPWRCASASSSPDLFADRQEVSKLGRLPALDPERARRGVSLQPIGEGTVSAAEEPFAEGAPALRQIGADHQALPWREHEGKGQHGRQQRPGANDMASVAPHRAQARQSQEADPGPSLPAQPAGRPTPPPPP